MTKTPLAIAAAAALALTASVALTDAAEARDQIRDRGLVHSFPLRHRRRRRVRQDHGQQDTGGRKHGLPAAG